MWQFRPVLVGLSVGVLAVVGSSWAEDFSASIRTYTGETYRITGAAFGVQYTIGTIKEKKAEAPGAVTSTISLTTTAPAPGGPDTGSGGAGGPQGNEPPEVHGGQADLRALPISVHGAEMQIPWNQIRSIDLRRSLLERSALPPYVPAYRYAATVRLVSGDEIAADSVNLGGAVLRGETAAGRVRVPWHQVEYIAFDH